MALLRPTHENILMVVNYVLNRNTADARVAYNVSTDWENRAVTISVRNKSMECERYVYFDDMYEWPENLKKKIATAKREILQ